MYFERRDDAVAGVTHTEPLTTVKINGILQTLPTEEEI